MIYFFFENIGKHWYISILKTLENIDIFLFSTFWKMQNLKKIIWFYKVLKLLTNYKHQAWKAFSGSSYFKSSRRSFLRFQVFHEFREKLSQVPGVPGVPGEGHWQYLPSSLQPLLYNLTRGYIGGGGGKWKLWENSIFFDPVMITTGSSEEGASRISPPLRHWT